MFKIIAVVMIGIFGGVGFFDLAQEAYTLATLLLGIGALLDYSQKRTAAKEFVLRAGRRQRTDSVSPKAAPVDSR